MARRYAYPALKHVIGGLPPRNMTEADHWQTVQAMLRGYRAAQVLITCAHLGVFRHLAAGALRGPALAVRIGTAPEALGPLLNAALPWIYSRRRANVTPTRHWRQPAWLGKARFTWVTWYGERALFTSVGAI